MAADEARQHPLGGGPTRSHHRLHDLVSILRAPVVDDKDRCGKDGVSTTSERVRGECRVRQPTMPGRDISMLKPADLLQSVNGLEHVVLLLPINYVGTQMAIPSPLTDAQCVGQQLVSSMHSSMQSSVFYHCNASAVQWLAWVTFFSRYTLKQLWIFVDCHGYDHQLAPPRAAGLLGYPAAAVHRLAASAASSQAPTTTLTLRTQHARISDDDFVTCTQIREVLLQSSKQNPACKMVMLADCCHGASVFGASIDARIPNVWYVLASDRNEEAHIRRVMGVFTFFFLAILRTEPRLTFTRLKQRLNTVLPDYQQHAVVAGWNMGATLFSGPTLAPTVLSTTVMCPPVAIPVEEKRPDVELGALAVTFASSVVLKVPPLLLFPLKRRSDEIRHELLSSDDTNHKLPNYGRRHQRHRGRRASQPSPQALYPQRIRRLNPKIQVQHNHQCQDAGNHAFLRAENPAHYDRGRQVHDGTVHPHGGATAASNGQSQTVRSRASHTELTRQPIVGGVHQVQGIQHQGERH